jgi:hypothetical protein
LQIAEVKLDGVVTEFDRATGRIRLPQAGRPIELLVATRTW